MMKAKSLAFPANSDLSVEDTTLPTIHLNASNRAQIRPNQAKKEEE